MGKRWDIFVVDWRLKNTYYTPGSIYFPAWLHCSVIITNGNLEMLKFIKWAALSAKDLAKRISNLIDTNRKNLQQLTIIYKREVINSKLPVVVDRFVSYP